MFWFWLATLLLMGGLFCIELHFAAEEWHATGGTQ